MRIVMINHEFPPVGGGAASACEQLAQRLSGAGHAVEVLTCRVPGRALWEERDGYRVRWQLGIRTSLSVGKVHEVFFFLVHAVWYCFVRFRQEKPALVIAFFSLPAGLVGWAAKKAYGVPYVVFLRGCDVPGVHQGWFRIFLRWLRPLIALVFAGADGVIANSEYLKTLARPLAPTRPIQVIPNSVDTALFCPASPAARRQGQGVTFLTVGRIDAQKRTADIVQALASVRRTVPAVPVQLRIIGDGAQKKRVEQRCRWLQLWELVLFEGWQQRSAMPQFYQQADVFVSASLDESMPNAVLEAMACGLAVIATDIPAHRELLADGKTGLLVPVKNPVALAAAMALLAREEKQRLALGQAARRQAERYAAPQTAAMFAVERFVPVCS